MLNCSSKLASQLLTFDKNIEDKIFKVKKNFVIFKSGALKIFQLYSIYSDSTDPHIILLGNLQSNYSYFYSEEEQPGCGNDMC